MGVAQCGAPTRIRGGRRTKRNRGTGYINLRSDFTSVQSAIHIINEISRDQKRSLINARDQGYARAKFFPIKHR